MKTRILLTMLALCLLTSCENNTQKGAEKVQICTEKQEETPKSTEEIAHAHGAITIDEFKDMRFSYVIEKNLPCLIYLERFHVNDIVSALPEKSIVFDPIIDVSTSVSIGDYDGDIYVGDCDTETGWNFQSQWYGTPSERKNECWIEGRFIGSSLIVGVSGYVGIDKTQVDWVIRKAQGVEYDFQDVEDTPIIIKVYQTRNGAGSIKADLVAILNEE